jgi:hypothetical protein
MSAENSRGRRFFGVLIATALCLVVAQTDALSAQSSQPSQSKSTRQAPFALTIDNNLISLTARDASIKAILEELGRRMNFTVVATIPAEETITAEFNRLPLKKAVKRLTANYAYVTDSAKDTGRLTKIMIAPGGKGVARAVSAPNKSTKEMLVSQPEPLRCDFDPMK